MTKINVKIRKEKIQSNNEPNNNLLQTKSHENNYEKLGATTKYKNYIIYSDEFHSP